MVKDIIVFRYGHRIVRDFRVTTHVCLVARALKASKIIIGGLQDNELEQNINRINLLWGGDFKVEFVENWWSILKEYKRLGYSLVHLTMYGEESHKRLKNIIKKDKILVVIGSQKVPREIYELSDYNISIGNQPHSEIGALAIFLSKLIKDKQMYSDFKNAKIKILPSKLNKNILKLDKNSAK